MPDSEIELERVYTVPLSKAWIAPRHRRVVRAVNMLREFAGRHMKSEEIKIDSELNETLWKRGITRPPRRITVKMTKDEDGLVTISLPKPAEEEEKPEEVKEEETLPAPQEATKAEPVKEVKQEIKPIPKATPSESKPKSKPAPKKKEAAKKKPTKAASGGKKKKPKASKKK